MKPHAWIWMTASYLLAMQAVTFGPPVAQAQAYNVLHHFTGKSDGANPLAGVTMDPAGSLYGTTSTGGAKGMGTVYRLTRSGSSYVFSLLYAFQGQTDGGV